MNTGLLPAIAWAVAAAVAATPPAPPASDLARLSLQNELLQKQVELAKGKEFYLLLDPRAQTLTLMFRAALLQQYHVGSI